MYPLTGTMDAESFGRFVSAMEALGADEKALMANPKAEVDRFVAKEWTFDGEGRRMWFRLLSAWNAALEGRNVFPELPLSPDAMADFLSARSRVPACHAPNLATQRWKWVDFDFPTSVIAKATGATPQAVSMARTRIFEKRRDDMPELLAERTGLSLDKIRALVWCDIDDALDALEMLPDDGDGSWALFDGVRLSREEASRLGTVAEVAARKGEPLDRIAILLWTNVPNPYKNYDFTLDSVADVPDGSTSILRIDAGTWGSRTSAIRKGIIRGTGNMREFFRLNFRNLQFREAEDIVLAMSLSANVGESDAVRILWTRFGQDVMNYRWSLCGGNSAMVFDGKRAETVCDPESPEAVLSDMVACFGPVAEAWARREGRKMGFGFHKGTFDTKTFTELLTPRRFAEIALPFCERNRPGRFYGTPVSVEDGEFRHTERNSMRIVMERLGWTWGTDPAKKIPEEFERNFEFAMAGKDKVVERLVRNGLLRRWSDIRTLPHQPRIETTGSFPETAAS